MNDYIEKLRRLGIKPHSAVRIVNCIKENLYAEILDVIIEKLENDKNVGILQSKSS